MPKKLLLGLLLALCCTGMAWANCGHCGDKHEGGCDKDNHAAMADSDMQATHDMDMDDDNDMDMQGVDENSKAFKEGHLVSVYDCRVLDPRCCPGDCYDLMHRFHHDECDKDEEDLDECDCCPKKCETCEHKPCTCHKDDKDNDSDCHCNCYMPYTPPGPRQPLVTVHLFDALYESNLEPLVEEQPEEVVTVEGRG